jgi:uncharacterized protein YbaA (DUF1428 family)
MAAKKKTKSKAAKTTYVEGFVLAVPTRNKAAYLKMAKIALPMFKSYGLLRLVECWQDDVPKGKWTDFFRAVKAKPGESVVFAWMEWPDKKTRIAGHKKMMADPGMAAFKDMPFDGKRMIFGGFKPMLDG